MIENLIFILVKVFTIFIYLQKIIQYFAIIYDIYGKSIIINIIINIVGIIIIVMIIIIIIII